MNNRQGNRPTHTSHGAGGLRGNYNHSNNQAPNQQANIHNSNDAQNVLKGRASSSYGSLQSRTNGAIVSSSSIVKQYPQGQNQPAGTNLNKSGISATSGVMLN